MRYFKAPADFQAKKYFPNSMLYLATQLDLVQGDFVVYAVEGDITKFKSDFKSPPELQLGDWDGMIEQKIIYPNRAGKNGYERINQ